MLSSLNVLALLGGLVRWLWNVKISKKEKQITIGDEEYSYSLEKPTKLKDYTQPHDMILNTIIGIPIFLIIIFFIIIIALGVSSLPG